MTRMIKQFYALECQLFRNVNQYFDRKHLNAFFRTITHFGGAKLTISTTLLLILFASQPLQLTAVASAFALTISHIPVAILKKLYPRSRPYLVLDHIKVTDNPLKDHSFPSGHTTAIFSVVMPFVLLNPTLATVLIPFSLAVGLSRIYLGLHFPSDVIAGMLLGSSTGMLCFFVLKHLFSHSFI